MAKRMFVLSAALLLSCLVLSPQALRADTITFFDTGNTITVGHDGTHTVMLYNTQTSSFGSCSATELYQCDIYISNGAYTPTSSQTSLNIAEAGVDPTLAVSDTLFANPGQTNYLVIFASDRPDDPNSTIGLTPATGAPSMSETADIQTAFTLTWSDGTTDTIRFQSDLDTPEPSSLLLLASGLAVLGACVGKKMLQLV